MPNSYTFTCILLSALILACSSKSQKDIRLPFYNDPSLTPEWIETYDPRYEGIHQIADFSFSNQQGETITQDHLENKIHIADFFFTFCPSICPKLTRNMKSLQENYIADPEIALVSYTVAPWLDSVTVLARYAETHGIKAPKWQLLTGDEKEIYTLARRSYFADKDIGRQKDENDFLHTENFILVDTKRRIRGVYNGTLAADMNRLKEDIEFLKQEK